MGTSGRVLSVDGLDSRIRTISPEGYRVLGPSVVDDLIRITDISGVADLPAGVGDVQTAGKYAIRQRSDGALFGFATPADTWKKYMFPPRVRLQSIAVPDGDEVVEHPPQDDRPVALLGVRACDLAALRTHDRVLLDRVPDTDYAARRTGALLIAVDCHTPADSCFCASMTTGPTVREENAADLILTELLDEHRFLVRSGTEQGAALLEGLATTEATDEDTRAAAIQEQAATDALTKSLDTTGLADLLKQERNNPIWKQVAETCLSCGNCTMMCPTCFCVSVEDEADALAGRDDRVRRWSSCFELDYSYLHGGSIRESIPSRYRQWLSHKFSTWWDQFDTSGCIGCGRCVTWCPVGIDVTESCKTIQEHQGQGLM